MLTSTWEAAMARDKFDSKSDKYLNGVCSLKSSTIIFQVIHFNGSIN